MKTWNLWNGGAMRFCRAGLQRSLAVLAALLIPAGAFAAESYTPATISDKDGYTNVRKSPASGAPVAGRVENNEPFLTRKSDSDWWPVRTRKGVNGYMHMSRIRMVATIEDPDGFTYVRRGKGASHEITGKVWAGEAFIAAPSSEAWWVVWMPDGRRGYMHRSRITALPTRVEEKTAPAETPAPVEEEKKERPPVEEPPADGLSGAVRERIQSAVRALIGEVGSEFSKRETLKKAGGPGGGEEAGGDGLQALATVWLREQCVENAIAAGLPDLTAPQATELALVAGWALDGELAFDGLSNEAQEEAIRGHMKTSAPGESAMAEILFFLRTMYQSARPA